MNHAVVWQPPAEQRLAAIWLAAPDRQAVTAAANRIDVLLGTNPSAQGEPHYASIRVNSEPPLTIWFEVYETERQVYVLTVRYVPRPDDDEHNRNNSHEPS